MIIFHFIEEKYQNENEGKKKVGTLYKVKQPHNSKTNT